MKELSQAFRNLAIEKFLIFEKGNYNFAYLLSKFVIYGGQIPLQHPHPKFGSMDEGKFSIVPPVYSQIW